MNDDPEQAVQALCADKILLSSTELAERFTKLFNHYAERLATRRAIEAIGEDFDLTKIPFGPAQIEASVANRLMADQRQRLATLTKGDQR